MPIQRVRENYIHFTAFRPHIGKRIENMCQPLRGEVLRVVIASVDRPSSESHQLGARH